MIDYSVLALPKGEPTKRAKRRKEWAEIAQRTLVRAACVERDGNCRLCYSKFDDVVIATALALPAEGLPQWAHMHSHRRSKTRGEAPERRHTTRATLMLCQGHHDHYDGRRYPRLLITALSRRGADGALKFRRAK